MTTFQNDNKKTNYTQVTASDLLSDIKTLLEIYFSGNFSIINDSIELDINNGQTYILNMAKK